MSKKLLRYEDVLKEELKDPEFKKHYQEEGRKLAIGYKIAQARQRVHLSQKELAKRMNTTQTAVSRLESGNYCSLRTLEKVAQVTHSHLVVDLKA